MTWRHSVGLLDRPDSTLLLVILAVCVVGLLLLAAATFFPGLSSRLRPGRDAYPFGGADLSERLSPYGDRNVIDLAAAEQSQESASAAEAEPTPDVDLVGASAQAAGTARAKASAATVQPATSATETLARRGGTSGNA